MITKTPRLTILMVAMMAVLGTGGPIAAFATAYGSNNNDVNDSSLAGRILEDVYRIIEEEIGDIGVDELPTIPQPTSTPLVKFRAGESEILYKLHGREG